MISASASSPISASLLVSSPIIYTLQEDERILSPSHYTSMNDFHLRVFFKLENFKFLHCFPSTSYPYHLYLKIRCFQLVPTGVYAGAYKIEHIFRSVHSAIHSMGGCTTSVVLYMCCKTKIIIILEVTLELSSFCHTSLHSLKILWHTVITCLCFLPSYCSHFINLRRSCWNQNLVKVSLKPLFCTYYDHFILDKLEKNTITHRTI